MYISMPVYQLHKCTIGRYIILKNIMIYDDKEN